MASRMNNLLAGFVTLLAVMASVVTAVSAQEVEDPPPFDENMDARQIAERLLNLDLRRDVLYAHDRNFKHRMHLLLPQKRAVEGPIPLVIWIHGGGWISGDRGDRLDRVIPLILSGRYAVASIDYRTSVEERWPAQLHDCKAALRWLRAHADQFDLDPDRFAVMGTESGGHLAAMLGTTATDEALEGDLGRHLDARGGIACVIDLRGPTDFLQMDDHLHEDALLRHSEPGSPEIRLVGGTFERKMDLVRSANPITHIDGPNPPFLIVHGRDDLIVPHHQSELLVEALRKNGDEVAFVSVTNGADELLGTEMQKIVMQFLDHVLYGTEEAVPSMEISIDRSRERSGRRSQQRDRGGGKDAEAPRGEREGREERPARGNRGEGRRSSAGERAFQRADRNGDGMIQEEEMGRSRRSRDAFKEHDENLDGALDLEEYLKLIKALSGEARDPGRGAEPGPPA